MLAIATWTACLAHVCACARNSAAHFLAWHLKAAQRLQRLLAAWLCYLQGLYLVDTHGLRIHIYVYIYVWLSCGDTHQTVLAKHAAS